MVEPNNIIHSSQKEEKDYLFDYKDIDLTSLEKVNLLGVDFDNVSRDEAIAHIMRFIEVKESYKHILFLDPVKFMEMREGKELHRIAKKADLILYEGAGLGWAAQKLNKYLKERISIISLMMDIFRYSEKKNFTVFLLGAKEEILERLHFILVRRFPELRIVGRQAGFFDKPREIMIKEVIRKSNPDIIFFAMDYLEQEKWIENNTGSFGKAVVIGVSGTFDVLSGMVKKSPAYFQDKGLTWLWRVISQPWNLKKLWNTIYFYLLFQYKGSKNKS